MDVLGKLLFNLKTISTIPKGKRISTAKEFITIDDTTTMQGFWRWKKADSRDKAVDTICREVRTTITLGKFILESYHLLSDDAEDELTMEYDLTSVSKLSDRQERIMTLKKIRIALLEASVGIGNLCQTYGDDASISGHLKPLIGEINDCVTSITQKLLNMGEYLT